MLWFGVTCFDEVLDDLRPSDCLTCPGEGRGEGFEGMLEAGSISRGEVGRDDIVDRGRFGGRDEGDGVDINGLRCRFECYGSRFEVEVVVTRVLVQEVSAEDDIPLDVCGHEERVLDNGLTN